MAFPKNFIWGAASSDYQIEGAAYEGGKGEGIWDALSAGHVRHGETGEVACDHYHRYKEDIALMKSLGIKAYRFSVSWPRVMPRQGVVNQEGLDFYKNLVQELLAAGIEPMCTLFHWNLPMWVYEQGGWHNEKTAGYFAEFVAVVADALSDKVSKWMTLNETTCFIEMGYVTGEHAPFEKALGENARPGSAYIGNLTRNALLAHGKAVKVLRERAKLPPQIGIAYTSSLFAPEAETPEEIKKAYDLTFPDKEAGLWSLSWWADPVFLGCAPRPLANYLDAEDYALIAQPLDFIGFNCYHASNFHGEPQENPNVYTGIPRTASGWPITPNALYWASRFLTERYHAPLLITENGMANLDFVMHDGKVHDPQRIDYLTGYLGGLKRAADEGLPVLGYCYWSILDNFEWAEGYDKRFGLVYVDYRTQQRIPKDSAYWYAEVIRQNGEML